MLIVQRVADALVVGAWAAGVLFANQFAAGRAAAQQVEAVTTTAAEPAAPTATVAAEPSPAAHITAMAKALGNAHPHDVAALETFYAATPTKLLWTNANGLDARGRAVKAEIANADEWGLSSAHFELPSDEAALGHQGQIEAEARLSLAVLKYARHARGGRLTPTALSDNLDRTLNLMEPTSILAGIAAADEPDAWLRRLHPQHPQFERLRQLYLSLKAGTYQPEPPPVAAEPAPEPPSKKRKRAKVAKPKTPPAPPPITIERVLANMEQWRWMPEDLGTLHAWVNIPEFMVRVVRNGSVIHAERVIVGTPANQTPIFSKEMKTVVFQPGWGVPPGIKVKELLPRLLAGGDPISSRGLIVRHRGRETDPLSINWHAVDIRRVSIVQPPGPSNALGMVKFLFPNKHDVYMHDTPSKKLFNADVRAFSHGCVRVRNPLRLAEIVFAETGGWSASRVAGLARAKPENEVTVPGQINVHLTYFTVTVDDQGKPHSFRDLYGHEPRIKAGLEGRHERIATQRHEDLGRLREQMISKARGSRRAPRAAEIEEGARSQRQRARQSQRQSERRRVIASSSSSRSNSGGFSSIFAGF